MATETVENYLKAIYTLCRESPTGEAGMTRVAAIVGVTTGTATTMIKRLAAAKLARYERFGGVKLTAKGEVAALDILRRHRIVETFLVETLKLDWSQVHAEAERLEHAISPVVLAALDAHLGHPSVDPHGDPIPSAEGQVPEPRGALLSSFGEGARVRVSRIADQEAAFLKFIASHGLRPGATVSVLSVDASAETMTIRADTRPAVALAMAAATKVVCQAVRKQAGPRDI
ncbi:MAG: metal-dependent transcriptional regulator [Phycisphaeraceae bacterium]|nr:metal-dependent transcriptional regulator [Phycisphaeraceae bacterium]